MKKYLSLFLVISIIFCFAGCGKSEDDYKSAIYQHMKTEHGASSISYESLKIRNDKSAVAHIDIAMPAQMGGTIEMSNQLTLDKDCNINSCTWCELGL